jgi:hypothetical protein
MKLRIRGNSIRLRLNQKDIAKIRSDKLCEETVEFPSGNIFSYQLLVLNEVKAPEVDFVDNTIKVKIGENEAQTWIETDQIGIYGEHGKIKISIEKDFRCLTARDEEEDKDAFPHPKEGAESC